MRTTKTATLTIRVSEKTKAKLEKIARLSRRTKSWHAAEALDIYLKSELPIVESIVQAQADMNAGKGIPHERVWKGVDKIIANAMAKQKNRA
jgi:predicted transcriptional regulator